MRSFFFVYLRPACLYGSTFLLILLYANLFVLWRWCNNLLGEEIMAILPVVITLFCLAVIVVFLKRAMYKGIEVDWKWATTGILFCLVALLIPDASVPVKKIHIPEYILLSLLVRYVMSSRLHGLSLLFFSAAMTSLLGIHDELLQGFHPSRTYGITDLSTDTVSGFGGAMIWHSASLFSSTADTSDSNDGISALTICYLTWLVIAVGCLVFPLAQYRQIDLPYWPFLPLGAAPVFFAFHAHRFGTQFRYGMNALSWTAFLFFLYLPVSHVATLSFN